MLKKITLSLLTVLMALSILMPATALAEGPTVQSDSVFSPNWTYIADIGDSLGIDSSGKAAMTSLIVAYSGTSVSMINYLQRYENGSWTSVQGWSSSTQGTRGNWSNTYYVYSGYNYRLLTYFYVYNNGSLLESTSITSPTKYY